MKKLIFMNSDNNETQKSAEESFQEKYFEFCSKLLEFDKFSLIALILVSIIETC